MSQKRSITKAGLKSLFVIIIVLLILLIIAALFILSSINRPFILPWS